MKTRSMAVLAVERKTKTPIEDTVRATWADIVVAANNGHSREAIRMALRNEGLHVGSKSGFRLALARVAVSEGLDLAELFSPLVAKAAPPASSSTGDQCPPLSVSDDPPASVDPKLDPSFGDEPDAGPGSDGVPHRRTFADPRFKSNY